MTGIKEAEFKTSELLTRHNFRHAFFTRRGGVSRGPYESLSFSYAAGDSKENVRANLERAGRALDVAPEKIFFLSQVHGTALRTLKGDEDREVVLFEEGDAVLSDCPDVACGVRTADCVPVLLADLHDGRAAAVHAGWRGVHANIVGEVVRAFGAGNRLVAAVGPHISWQSFEVSDDVAEQLQAVSPAPDVVDRSRSKPHVNLRGIVHAQLVEAGLDEHCVDHVEGCTVLDSELYFSYRRDGRASGRHLSAIRPRSRID